MITDNANKYMSEDLIDAVVDVLKVHNVLRITFYPPGTDPTATECILDNELLARCRDELKDDAPIRLYFSRRTKNPGRKQLPFKDEVMSLVKQGHDPKLLATVYSITPQTIGNWVRAEGEEFKANIPVQTHFDYDQAMSAIIEDMDGLKKNT